jgi:hypothetical protein
VVHLVEVDVVGLQPLQRGVRGTTDVERRELALVGPVTHVAVELGGEHGALAATAAAGEPAAEDLLGLAGLGAVAVGGVEEVEAVLVSGVHDRVAVGLAGAGAEVHRAQAQRGDLEAGAAELAIVHVSNLLAEGARASAISRRACGS